MSGFVDELLARDAFVRVVVNTGELQQGATATAALVAGVEGKRIRVVAAELQSDVSTFFMLESDDGTDLLGLQANNSAPHALSFNPAGWCEAKPGEALVLREINGTASRMRGVLVYLLV